MKARVVVTLKPDVLDPQGKAVEGALSSLGLRDVASVRQGKIFDIDVSTDNPAAVQKQLEKACESLLANPVIEDYEILLDR